jgi:LCP family protein required for cell wall assembly
VYHPGSGVEVKVRNTVEVPVQDRNRQSVSSVPESIERPNAAMNPDSPPHLAAPTTRKLPWMTRVLWSGTFITAATVSATVGAIVAMIAPLPSALNFLNVREEIATAETPNSAENNGNIPSLLDYTVERPVNILVMGIDRVPGAPPGSPAAFEGHTDTMLLMRFDPRDQTLKILSIPRDTRVPIDGYGMSKINDANIHGGAKLVREVLSENLNGVEVDRYVRVTNDAFRELVDLVGGIEVYVPKDMKYTDKTQGLEIDLKQGTQVLNGDQAEQFARFRKDEFGDISRVQRQQVLLKALRQRLQHPSVVPNLPKIAQLMLDYVDTNLSFEEILALVNLGMEINPDTLQMVLLPGRFSDLNEFSGVSYWVMSEEGRDRVMADYFDRYDPEMAATDRSVQSVRIAIQNATNDPQVARAAAAKLRQAGFTNLVYSNTFNTNNRLSRTEIVMQQGDREAAEAVQAALGLGAVRAESTGDLGSEITVRVGSDGIDVLLNAN